MYIGSSIFTIAVGAILAYGVSDRLSGIDLDTVGLILIVLGVVGLVVSLFYLATGRDRVYEPVVYEDAPPAPRQHVFEPPIVYEETTLAPRPVVVERVRHSR